MKRTFSGKILVRTTPEIHQGLYEQAQREDISLNTWVQRLFMQSAQVKKIGSRDTHFLPQWGSQILPLLQREFKEKLLGVLLFGSYARGEASTYSDVDLLVILSKEVTIDRDLYRRLDRKLTDHGFQNISFHFVPFPVEITEVGSLWFEVALEGILLYLADEKILGLLTELKNQIASNKLERHWSHGHPYWRRAS